MGRCFDWRRQKCPKPRVNQIFMNKKELLKLIAELEKLRNLAEYRSNMIIENGIEVPMEHRAKSAGCADTYSYCIMRLREHVVNDRYRNII
jgi:hypothetical protein